MTVEIQRLMDDDSRIITNDDLIAVWTKSDRGQPRGSAQRKISSDKSEWVALVSDVVLNRPWPRAFGLGVAGLVNLASKMCYPMQN